MREGGATSAQRNHAEKHPRIAAGLLGADEVSARLRFVDVFLAVERQAHDPFILLLQMHIFEPVNDPHSRMAASTRLSF